MNLIMSMSLGLQVIFDNKRVVPGGRDFDILEATYSLILEATYVVVGTLKQEISADRG